MDTTEEQNVLIFTLPSGEELRVMTVTEVTLQDGNLYAALIEENLVGQLSGTVAEGKTVPSVELIYAQKVGMEYRRVEDPAILDTLTERVAETLAGLFTPFEIKD